MFQGSLNGTHFGGIRLDCKCLVILRDFPKIIVHEVWVGNIMIPAFQGVELWTSSPSWGIFLDLFGKINLQEI